MPTQPGIETGLAVKGLSELQRSLGKVAPEAKKQLVANLKDVGGLLAAETQTLMAKDFRHPSGKAKRSVRTKLAKDAVTVVEGGKTALYVPWLDFGGTVGKGRKSTTTLTVFRTASGKVRTRSSTNRSRGTGSVVRKYIKGGRYLYVARGKVAPAMRQAVTDAVVGAAQSAGLEVSTRGH